MIECKGCEYLKTQRTHLDIKGHWTTIVRAKCTKLNIKLFKNRSDDSYEVPPSCLRGPVVSEKEVKVIDSYGSEFTGLFLYEEQICLSIHDSAPDCALGY